MKKMRWVLSASLVLTLIATANAQRFGESVQVTIVEVPVTVVDRAGNTVRGLTREDFEVFDEGKRVPIEYFEVVEMAGVTAAAAAPDAPPPPAITTRNFLLLFDLANSSPGTIGRATTAAKSFVDAQIGDRDQAAVAVFTAEAGMKIITSFTRNRVLLENAIETLGNPQYFKVADPLMISAIVSGRGDPTNPSNDRGTGRSELDAATTEGARELNRMNQSTHDSEMRNRLKIQLSNFGMVARALDGLAGQKQVILLSEGFDARLVQGSEERSFEKTQADSDAVLSGEVWNVNNEERFGSTSSSTDVGEMARLFRRSDVTLHAIDIKGLRSGVDASAGVKRSSNEALHLITAPTGGTVFKNANDLGESFGRMLKQQEVVYLLGFSAKSTGKPGRFHELKVKTKDGRPSHRAGYYEAGARLSGLERTLNLAEIMVTDAPMRDVDITVTPTALPGPAGKARVPVLVEIPGKRLLEGIAGKTATANLYLYAFDDKNQVVDFLQQRISLDLEKAGDTVRGSGVRYFGTLKLAPGKYAVKSVVQVDETGRTGFVRSDLMVPAFDKAVVSGPVLFTQPENWVMLVGPSRGDDYAYPFAAGEDRYIPKNNADLKITEEYKVALFLFRVPLENLEVKPELVTSGSSQTANVTLLGRTAADERGGVKLLFSFKPAGIPAGEHQLRFTVKPKDGHESVVTMPFRVL